jgi:hypothetical protein
LIPGTLEFLIKTFESPNEIDKKKEEEEEEED